MHVTALPRPVRYLGVGATGVPVDVGVTLLVATVVGILPAQAAGWAVAATWNWFWNASVTWDGDRSPREWLRYLGVDAGRLAVRIGVVWAFVGVLPDVVATIFGIVTAAGLGFVGFDRFVFGSVGDGR